MSVGFVQIYLYHAQDAARIQLRSYGPSLEEERVWGRRRERLRCGHIRGPVGRRCSRGEGSWSPTSLHSSTRSMVGVPTMSECLAKHVLGKRKRTATYSDHPLEQL